MRSGVKFWGSLIILGTLEHFSSLNFKLKCDIVLDVSNPFLVAGKELAIFLLSGGQGFECITRETFLVALEMFGHVITNETLEEVQLEVVFLVEIFALHSLSVCVVIVGVAFVSKIGHKLLLSLKAKFSKDTLLKVDLDTFDGILHLHERLRLDAPWSGGGLKRVQWLCLLITEEFGLGYLGHIQFIY